MDIRAVVGKTESARTLVQKRRRLFASFGVCFLALFFTYHVFAGSNGIRAYYKKRAENKALQHQIEDLKKENDSLNQRVRALRSDPDAIEKEAREQLKYAKPGEVVYVVPEPKQASQPTTASAEKP